MLSRKALVTVHQKAKAKIIAEGTAGLVLLCSREAEHEFRTNSWMTKKAKII